MTRIRGVGRGAYSGRKPSMLSRLRARGFDLSEYNRSSGYWLPRCSQCQVLVINGHATHETGCPNIVRPEEEKR